MNLDIDLFKIEHNNVLPQKGKLLISEPFLHDSFFKNSVILLTEHNENGTIGFILNKPMNIPVSEILSDFPKFEGKASVGGPVSANTIHYIHTLGEAIPQSIVIYDNIFWGGDFNQVKLLIEAGILTHKQIRFFIGYSGWEPKQLDDEISRNSWLVTDFHPSDLFDIREKDIWKKALLRMGSKFSYWTNFPDNPSLN